MPKPCPCYFPVNQSSPKVHFYEPSITIDIFNILVRMNTMHTFRIIKIIFVSLVIITSLPGCLDLAGGDNKLIKENLNAAGNLKAVLFLKESGATGADSYQVLITSPNLLLKDSDVGNAFTMKANHDATGLYSKSINISWVSNDTLLIEYDNKLMTYIQNNRVGHVAILYHSR